MGPVGTLLAWSGIFVVSTIFLALWEAVHDFTVRPASRCKEILTSRYSRTAWTTALVVMMLSLSALLDQPIPEILYGKF
jgi:hypothetical protein